MPIQLYIYVNKYTKIRNVMAVGLQVNSILCLLHLLYTMYLQCKFTKFGAIKRVSDILKNKN